MPITRQSLHEQIGIQYLPGKRMLEELEMAGPQVYRGGFLIPLHAALPRTDPRREQIKRDLHSMVYGGRSRRNLADYTPEEIRQFIADTDIRKGELVVATRDVFGVAPHEVNELLERKRSFTKELPFDPEISQFANTRLDGAWTANKRLLKGEYEIGPQIYGSAAELASTVLMQEAGE